MGGGDGSDGELWTERQKVQLTEDRNEDEFGPSPPAGVLLTEVRQEQRWCGTVERVAARNECRKKDKEEKQTKKEDRER